MATRIKAIRWTSFTAHPTKCLGCDRVIPKPMRMYAKNTLMEDGRQSVKQVCGICVVAELNHLQKSVARLAAEKEELERGHA